MGRTEVARSPYNGMLSVLRIFGSNFDVDGFLGRYPKLGPDAVWRRGDVRRGRAPATSSGFNITIGEGRAWLSAVDRFCESAVARALLADAQGSGAEAVLDVAVGVGGESTYTAAVSFSSGKLRLFADLGATLVVSAYPVRGVKKNAGRVRGKGARPHGPKARGGRAGAARRRGRG